jgi:5-methylcytosine-specific restriction protein A
MANPLCVICAAKGYVKMANVVDHIIPHKGDKALFYDFDNLQSLCTRCHNRKTAREDGGFGNKQR